MVSEVDGKVAMALLSEVEKHVEQILDNQVAKPLSLDNDPTEVVERASFCKEMIEQCELAEKKAPANNEVLLRSLILKAQIYGNWQKLNSVRGTHKKAYECYENALKLVSDPATEADIRYRFALACRVLVIAGKDTVIENFEKVIQLVGADSELGIECAKELEKEKSRKDGCFIATAVYDSYNAPEVIILREFRDEVLLKTNYGRAIVRYYYMVSPLVAKFISRKELLKKWVKLIMTEPIVRYLRKNKKGFE